MYHECFLAERTKPLEIGMYPVILRSHHAWFCVWFQTLSLNLSLFWHFHRLLMYYVEFSINAWSIVEHSYPWSLMMSTCLMILFSNKEFLFYNFISYNGQWFKICWTVCYFKNSWSLLLIRGVVLVGKGE